MKNNDEIREYISECGFEDILLFENPSFAEAFVGISEDNKAVYDFNKMIESLASEYRNDKSTEDSYGDNYRTMAIEWIEHNTLRSLPYYENSPIVYFPIEEA